jgi:hypothetical protein
MMGNSLFYEGFSTVLCTRFSRLGHGEDTTLQTFDTSCHYQSSIDYTITEHTSMKRALYVLLEFESEKK